MSQIFQNMFNSLVTKYQLETNQSRSNFPLGNRIKSTAHGKNVFISLETINSSAASTINALTTLQFECQIDASDEFFIEKLGFLQRIFSKKERTGVFCLDVSSKSTFFDLICNQLNNKEWRNLNEVKISLKDEKFVLKAITYREEYLNFVYTIIQEILDSHDFAHK